MVLNEVVEEELEVAVEVGDVLLRDERPDLEVAVHAEPDLVAGTVDGDGGNGLAGGRDGASTAEGSEPDHDLVGVGGTDGGGEPKVVGDVVDGSGASAGLSGGGGVS